MKHLTFISLVFFFAALVSVDVYATAYPFNELEEELVLALEDKGVQTPLSIEALYLKKDAYNSLLSPSQAMNEYGWRRFVLQDINVNVMDDRFNATVIAYANDESPKGDVVTLRGRITRMVEVPVLQSTLNSGDIIAQKDIDWITLPSKRLRNHTVTSADGLVGMQVRRRITGQKPVRSSEVHVPIVVEKGGVLTLIYESENIHLRTLGVALQDGREGELIRVRNIRSDKGLQAVVSEDGIATVNFGGAHELANISVGAN